MVFSRKKFPVHVVIFILQAFNCRYLEIFVHDLYFFLFISKNLELKAQDQASTSAAAAPPPRNKDAKSPQLPSFIEEKDKLDSYLLRFEHYVENASWEKNTWAIKRSALPTGRAMDVYTRMSVADANEYDKITESTLNQIQLHRRWLQKEIQGG